jgi:hypothetical protein
LRWIWFWCYKDAALAVLDTKYMNHQAIIFHLREAAEELNKTVKNLEQDEMYDKESLEVAMGHIYHHLNTAWNGRNQTDKQFRESTGQDFARFRKFPKENDFAYLIVSQ